MPRLPPGVIIVSVVTARPSIRKVGWNRLGKSTRPKTLLMCFGRPSTVSKCRMCVYSCRMTVLKKSSKRPQRMSESGVPRKTYMALFMYGMARPFTVSSWSKTVNSVFCLGTVPKYFETFSWASSANWAAFWAIAS
ncbi:hypothetical protein D3C72_1819480 [compost metagenome]